MNVNSPSSQSSFHPPTNPIYTYQWPFCKARERFLAYHTRCIGIESASITCAFHCAWMWCHCTCCCGDDSTEIAPTRSYGRRRSIELPSVARSARGSQPVGGAKGGAMKSGSTDLEARRNMMNNVMAAKVRAIDVVTAGTGVDEFLERSVSVRGIGHDVSRAIRRAESIKRVDSTRSPLRTRSVRFAETVKAPAEDSPRAVLGDAIDPSRMLLRRTKSDGDVPSDKSSPSEPSTRRRSDAFVVTSPLSVISKPP